MKQQEAGAPVRRPGKLVPGCAALALAASFITLQSIHRNTRPCGCLPDMATARRAANDNSQISSKTDARTSSATMTSAVQTAGAATTMASSDVAPNRLPRLLDLGADKCIPCKMMAPILDEMKEQYAGTLDVEFIDVWENPEEAEKFGVETIPTQIFFDASGKELFRHVGFFSKEDILSKWHELGMELGQ